MAKCKICKSEYEKRNMSHMVCGYECSLKYAQRSRDKKAKEKKKEINKEKKAFYAKDVTTQKMKAQNALNRYIRLRDNGNDCISCGCKVEKGDASHFFSVGSHSAVRFNINNVHLSCYKCNRFLHGNLVPYKPALIEKIGQERYDKLEEQSKEIKSYTNEYYKRIVKLANKRAKRYQK